MNVRIDDLPVLTTNDLKHELKKVSIENISMSLDYEYRGEQVSDAIEMLSIPSNLGIGRVWYFLCPITQKQCRKLYFHDGAFVSRNAMKYIYDSQLYSYKGHQRALYFEQRMYDIQDIIEGKHFKKTYNGKETTRYKHLKKLEACYERKMNECDVFFFHALEKLFSGISHTSLRSLLMSSKNLQKSEPRARGILGKLRKNGYIIDAGFDGKRRFLKVNPDSLIKNNHPDRLDLITQGDQNQSPRVIKTNQAL